MIAILDWFTALRSGLGILLAADGDEEEDSDAWEEALDDESFDDDDEDLDMPVSDDDEEDFDFDDEEDEEDDDIDFEEEFDEL